MIKQFNRGWKIDKNMNKVLRLVDDLISKTSLSLSGKIKAFNRITGKSRSSFFRYKRFLKDGIYYKRKNKHSDTKEYKKQRLNQIVNESYKVKFACNRWMREMGKSRSSFFRLKRGTKENTA